MNKTLVILALAAAFAGCQKEAEKFGYTGYDLQETDNLYLTTQAGVTNWLPARLLTVCEQYEITDDEKRLVEAAGVVWSGEPLKEIPAGFGKRDDEPWFVTWVKEVTAFGMKGTSGFISHFDEDRGEWQVGEAFFSTYWKTMDQAQAAAAELEKKIADFNPLKIHRLDAGFLAEYRRMRVIVVCGQRASGDFSCMLQFQDKNRSGCGQWEPIPEQEERVRAAKYMKALKAWRAAAGEVVLKNHAKVGELGKAKNLELFGEEASWFDSGDGSYVCCLSGQFDPKETEPRKFMEEKVAFAARVTGTTAGEIESAGAEGEGAAPTYYSASWKGDLYEVRVDVAASGMWRILCSEVLQEGFELPPRP